MSAEKKPESGKLVRLRPPRTCPICSKPAVRESWPFCSNRCADVDLNRWLSGQYRIPAAPEEAETRGDDDGEGPGPRTPEDREA